MASWSHLIVPTLSIRHYLITFPTTSHFVLQACLGLVVVLVSANFLSGETNWLSDDYLAQVFPYKDDFAGQVHCLWVIFHNCWRSFVRIQHLKVPSGTLVLFTCSHSPFSHTLPRYTPPPSHNQKTTQLEEVIDTQKQDIEFLKTQIQSLTNSSAPSEEDRSTSEVSLGLGSSFNSTIESGPLKQQLVKLRNALRVCCVWVSNETLFDWVCTAVTNT